MRSAIHILVSTAQLLNGVLTYRGLGGDLYSLLLCGIAALGYANHLCLEYDIPKECFRMREVVSRTCVAGRVNKKWVIGARSEHFHTALVILQIEHTRSEVAGNIRNDPSLWKSPNETSSLRLLRENILHNLILFTDDSNAISGY
jgi:hypothetical protein